MTEHHEIDEYVRRLVPISDRAIAELINREAKARLRERITAPVGPDRTVPVPGPHPRRTRLALAGAAAGVIVLSGVAAAVVATNSSTTDQPPVSQPSAPPGTEPIPPDGEASCAFPTAADTEVAFDGTVTEIGPEHDLGTHPTYRQVTFQVNEWFYGGEAEQYTVVMPRPGSEAGSIDMPDYEVGSRLLVAADWLDDDRLDHPVSGFCGVTLYIPYWADMYRRNFDTE